MKNALAMMLSDQTSGADIRDPPVQDSKNRIAGIIFTQTTPGKSNLTSLEIRKMIRDIVE